MTERAISIDDFTFEYDGYGCYYVVYKSPITGDTWDVLTNDTYLINCTKNADKPLTKDLNKLKYLCKLKRY